MAPKHAKEAAKKKAAKQKKILIALSLPMLFALFFAYHTMTKLGAPVQPEVIGSSTSSPGVAAPAPSSSGSGTSSGTPVSATIPVTPTTDPNAGKLSNLSGLATKDPFFDAGPQFKAAVEGGANGSSGSNSGSGAGGKGKPSAPTTAVISVNGKLAAINVGSVFPVSKDPSGNGVFRLVALTSRTAKIAVVGGSYTNGGNTLTLAVNTVVTLVNTANGRKYTLILYPQGTVAP